MPNIVTLNRDDLYIPSQIGSSEQVACVPDGQACALSLISP